MTLTLREAVWSRDTAQAAGDADKAAHYHRITVAMRERDDLAGKLHRVEARLQSILNEDPR